MASQSMGRYFDVFAKARFHLRDVLAQGWATCFALCKNHFQTLTKNQIPIIIFYFAGIFNKIMI